MSANEFMVWWVDEDGQESKSRWFTDETDPVNLSDLIADMQELSEAMISRYAIKLNGVPAVAIPGAAGAYDIADKVVFEYLDSAGNTIKVAVPAPKTGIFSDSDNVDLNHADVITWNAAIKAIYESNHGATLATLVRGYRTRAARAA